MGAGFSRVKTWTTTEDVTAADINAEFDNILNNLTGANVDDSSANVTAMQATVDPGEVGTESLATSVEAELHRLRFILSEITGKDEWYESPITSLDSLNNAIGSAQTANRLVSGKIRTSSIQPLFLKANGAAATVTVEGATTNFVYFVEGVQYTILADTNLASLTVAPAANNTCLIDDANAADEDWTKLKGEDGSVITVDAMGSEITSLVGDYAAFSLAGTGTEYFIAKVKSTTELSDVRRGYFFDSSRAAVERAGFTNNDTITLLKLTWVFAKTDLTLTATFNNPIYSKDEPVSPANGDYWLDIANNKWKVRGVGSWSDADATLIGICAQDGTNTIASRSFKFFKAYSDENTYDLVLNSATEVIQKHAGSEANVFGETIASTQNARIWDITLDRDTGVSEAASTFFYFYLTEDGDVIISDIKPYDRRGDLGGYFHTHESWRCLGSAFNDSSQDLGDVTSYFKAETDVNVLGVPATTVLNYDNDVVILSGATHTVYLPTAARNNGKIIELFHGGTSLSQVYTIDGHAAETIRGATTFLLHTAGQKVKVVSDGTNWLVLDHLVATAWTTFTMTISGSGGAPTKASTTLVDSAIWKRVGQDILINYNYHHTDNTGAADGTGDYLFVAPTNVTFDTTLIAVNTLERPASYVGSAAVAQTTNLTANGFVKIYDATSLAIIGDLEDASAAQYAQAVGFLNMTKAELAYSFSARVPVTNWEY